MFDTVTMTRSAIAKCIATQALTEGDTIYAIFPHDEREGCVPTAIVVHRGKGPMPIVVHEAAIRETGVYYGSGDYFAEDDIEEALKVALRRRWY